MKDDRITVDEPLISTDVDSLIRTIADRGKVQLDDLRRECRIDKKTMDKWITVLEDEGYISIEYGIRGTSVIWKSPSNAVQSSIEVPGARPPMSAVLPSKILPEDVAAGAPEDDLVEAVGEETGEQPAQGTEFTTEVPLEEEMPEAEPEELLTRYLARKRSDGDDADSIKSSILTSMDDEPNHSEPEAPVYEEAEDDLSPEPEDEPMEESGALSFDAEAPQEREEALPTIRHTRARPPSVDVRELMSSYMDEINKEKATISRLEKEKEELYRDKVASMEGRLQADVVVLTEKIVEAQTRIADLKEHVLELPDRVDELDRIHAQMEALKTEGRGALERTRDNAEEFLSRLVSSKSDAEEKLSQAGLDLDSYSEKIKGLEKLGSSLDARSVKLKSALDSARAQAEELSAVVTALNSDMGDIEKARTDVAQAVESIKSSVAERGSELESLQQELEGIERMERWVQEYARDYEHKISEIESHISKSEDEMAELKEAAESLYLKKYLGELECMTESYQAELEDTVLEEQAIEQKISESRGRISQLVKESQEMIRKVRQETSGASEKSFGILVAKAKARTSMARQLVEEKQNERLNLASESDAASKSSKSGLSRKKPVRKPLRKKAAAKKKRK